jgi:hypothetical protein
MAWRSLLADRTLLVAGWLDDAYLAEWLGEDLAAPGVQTNERHFALVCAPAVAGIVSRYTTRGQLVKVNILPCDLEHSTELRVETRTLIERLCFRHGLERIVCLGAELADCAMEAAEALGGVKLVTAKGPESVVDALKA